AEGEAVPEDPAARRDEEVAAGLRLAEAAPVRRAPPEPCRLGVLPVALRGGGDPVHGRCRRVGDYLACVGPGQQLEMLREIHFPHSIGLLYSAFTYYTGFKVNSGEYKVMGLAPYGEPKYKDLILDKIVDLKEDGTFRLDQSYFDYCTGLRMTNDKFADLFGGP